MYTEPSHFIMNNLTMDELRRKVPAAFATEPAVHVSDRYSFIPTTRIISEVMDRGWLPVEARQSRRAVDQRHTTHMIVFRRPDTKLKIGGVLPQINWTNNHAAMRRGTLLGGFFKVVCSNGLVISAGIAETKYSRIHKDGAEFDIDEALVSCLGRLDEAEQDIDKWMSIDMNFGQRQEFAAKAVLVKNQNDPIWSAHFDAHEFLNVRRPEDKQNDLWTVFNVVQENIIQGGVRGANGTTRGITQVSEVMRINRGLWQLTQEYGNLHGTN
jgi:Domain of unknown function (DUF932)